ncbi:unnamed protein product [Linum trigynum]|uniref:Uncharacterized protein n=1 Tax=Linum trigynum TaxID=586398 RepID=A0AAV2FD24_9ROSI
MAGRSGVIANHHKKIWDGIVPPACESHHAILRLSADLRYGGSPSPRRHRRGESLRVPLRPSLLIIAISPPSLYLFDNLCTKTFIGSLILPEIPFSGNSIEPTPADKCCNIYELNGAANLTLLVSLKCPMRDRLCGGGSGAIGLVPCAVGGTTI